VTTELMLSPLLTFYLTNPIGVVFIPNELLNTMDDIKVTKLGNFIINSIFLV